MDRILLKIDRNAMCSCVVLPQLRDPSLVYSPRRQPLPPRIRPLYKRLNAVASLMADRLPHIEVIGNMVPPHLTPAHLAENKYVDTRTHKYVVYPSIGAFQVSLNGNCIFSKKKVNSWPDIPSLIQHIVGLLKGSAPKLLKAKSKSPKKLPTLTQNAETAEKWEDESADEKSKFTLTDHFRLYKGNKSVNKHSVTEVGFHQEESSLREKGFKKLGKEIIFRLDSIEEEVHGGEDKLPEIHFARTKSKMKEFDTQLKEFENKFKDIQERVSFINKKKESTNNADSVHHSRINHHHSLNQSNQHHKIVSRVRNEKIDQSRYSPRNNSIEEYINGTEKYKLQKLQQIYGEWKLPKKYFKLPIHQQQQKTQYSSQQSQVKNTTTYNQKRGPKKSFTQLNFHNKNIISRKTPSPSAESKIIINSIFNGIEQDKISDKKSIGRQRKQIFVDLNRESMDCQAIIAETNQKYVQKYESQQKPRKFGSIRKNIFRRKSVELQQQYESEKEESLRNVFPRNKQMIAMKKQSLSHKKCNNSLINTQRRGLINEKKLCNYSSRARRSNESFIEEKKSQLKSHKNETDKSMTIKNKVSKDITQRENLSKRSFATKSVRSGSKGSLFSNKQERQKMLNKKLIQNKNHSISKNNKQNISSRSSHSEMNLKMQRQTAEFKKNSINHSNIKIRFPIKNIQGSQKSLSVKNNTYNRLSNKYKNNTNQNNNQTKIINKRKSKPNQSIQQFNNRDKLISNNKKKNQVKNNNSKKQFKRNSLDQKQIDIQHIKHSLNRASQSKDSIIGSKISITDTEKFIQLEKRLQHLQERCKKPKYQQRQLSNHQTKSQQIYEEHYENGKIQNLKLKQYQNTKKLVNQKQNNQQILTQKNIQQSKIKQQQQKKQRQFNIHHKQKQQIFSKSQDINNITNIRLKQHSTNQKQSINQKTNNYEKNDHGMMMNNYEVQPSKNNILNKAFNIKKNSQNINLRNDAQKQNNVNQKHKPDQKTFNQIQNQIKIQKLNDQLHKKEIQSIKNKGEDVKQNLCDAQQYQMIQNESNENILNNSKKDQKQMNYDRSKNQHCKKQQKQKKQNVQIRNSIISEKQNKISYVDQNERKANIQNKSNKCQQQIKIAALQEKQNIDTQNKKQSKQVQKNDETKPIEEIQKSKNEKNLNDYKQTNSKTQLISRMKQQNIKNETTQNIQKTILKDKKTAENLQQQLISLQKLNTTKILKNIQKNVNTNECLNNHNKKLVLKQQSSSNSVQKSKQTTKLNNQTIKQLNQHQKPAQNQNVSQHLNQKYCQQQNQDIQLFVQNNHQKKNNQQLVKQQKKYNFQKQNQISVQQRSTDQKYNKKQIDQSKQISLKQNHVKKQISSLKQKLQYIQQNKKSDTKNNNRQQKEEDFFCINSQQNISFEQQKKKSNLKQQQNSFQSQKKQNFKSQNLNDSQLLIKSVIEKQKKTIIDQKQKQAQEKTKLQFLYQQQLQIDKQIEKILQESVETIKKAVDKNQMQQKQLKNQNQKIKKNQSKEKIEIIFNQFEQNSFINQNKFQQQNKNSNFQQSPSLIKQKLQLQYTNVQKSDKKNQSILLENNFSLSKQTIQIINEQITSKNNLMLNNKVNATTKNQKKQQYKQIKNKKTEIIVQHNDLKQIVKKQNNLIEKLVQKNSLKQNNKNQKLLLKKQANKSNQNVIVQLPTLFPKQFSTIGVQKDLTYQMSIQTDIGYDNSLLFHQRSSNVQNSRNSRFDNQYLQHNNKNNRPKRNNNRNKNYADINKDDESQNQSEQQYTTNNKKHTNNFDNKSLNISYQKSIKSPPGYSTHGRGFKPQNRCLYENSPQSRLLNKIPQESLHNRVSSRKMNFKKQTKSFEDKQIVRARIVKHLYNQQQEIQKFQRLSQMNQQQIQKWLRQYNNQNINVNTISACQLFEGNGILFGQSIQTELINPRNESAINMIKAFKILSKKNQLLLSRLFQGGKQERFVQKQQLFGVWLSVNSQWKCILIDDNIEVDNQQLPLNILHKNNQLWPYLLQKALYKIHQNVSQLSCATIFECLTGCNSLSFPIQQQCTRNQKWIRHLNKGMILHTIDSQFPTTKISYILSSKQVQQTDALSKQILIELKPQSASDESSWMTLPTIIASFNEVQLLHLHPHYYYTHCDIDCGRNQLVVLTLAFESQANGTVTLSHADKKCGPLRTFLYKEAMDNTLRLVGKAKEYNKQKLFFDCGFTAAKYVLFAQTQGQGRVAYAGEGKPTLQVVEIISEKGMKNQKALYMPVGKNKDKSMPKEIKREESYSRFKQNFVEYLINNQK